MHVIGITGGIGSGKSRICDYIGEKYKACILKTDDCGHDVMAPCGTAYDELCELLGNDYFLDDGKTFDRKKIGERAFKEPYLLEKMNSYIHPAVKKEIIKRLELAKKSGCEIGVIESALLIEAGYRDLCDEFWYVCVDRKMRLERLLSSRDITMEKAALIMDRQKSDAEFRKQCEFVIVNNDNFDLTKKQIDERIALLRNKQ